MLVVDDTEDSVEMLRQLLEGEGAEVAMALDGSGALKLAASAQFDLVISDISMPEMDGYELIQRLRREPQYAATPAFALTGFGRDEDVARALAAGFTHQLTKPLDFPALVRLIRAVLNR